MTCWGGGRGGAGRRTGDITALLRACLAVIRFPAEAGALDRVPGPPFWSIADAAERMGAMLPLEHGAVLEAFLPELPVGGAGQTRGHGPGRSVGSRAACLILVEMAVIHARREQGVALQGAALAVAV